jgi:hypothetical protein
MVSSYVLVQGWFPYPFFSTEQFQIGDEWIADEIEFSRGGATRLERWNLFRSGQFVHNRAFDEIPPLGDCVEVMEILDTVTGALELAARMAERGVLSQYMAITFELYGLDGRRLTWLDDQSVVGPHCWCQDENVSVEKRLGADELKARRRTLALEVALDLYSKFGWSTAPKERLATAQSRRFGPLRA